VGRPESRLPKQDRGLSDPSHFRRSWWGRLVKKAGLPYIRFHDMRHTAATLLLAHGMPIKAVSEMLGHASVSITLNLYGHVLPHMQQQLADEMDSIIGVTVEESEDE
jgi:integrase